jgi:hypothetical protein
MKNATLCPASAGIVTTHVTEGVARLQPVPSHVLLASHCCTTGEISSSLLESNVV